MIALEQSVRDFLAANGVTEEEEADKAVSLIDWVLNLVPEQGSRFLAQKSGAAERSELLHALQGLLGKNKVTHIEFVSLANPGPRPAWFDEEDFKQAFAGAFNSDTIWDVFCNNAQTSYVMANLLTVHEAQLRDLLDGTIPAFKEAVDESDIISSVGVTIVEAFMIYLVCLIAGPRYKRRLQNAYFLLTVIARGRIPLCCQRDKPSTWFVLVA